MKAITLQTQEIDAGIAAAELITLATEQLGGDAPVAAFLFASTDYDHKTLLDALASHWPDLPLVGGSTDGEISNDGFADDSVVLTLISGKGLRARTGLGRDLSKDTDRAITDALSTRGQKVNLCWTVFAPTSNSTAVVRRLQAELGKNCPVVGGLTGDHREYTRMVEFCGREVLTDSLPVMFLEGDFVVSCGVGTGWFPIGEPLVVTKSDGHWIRQIGGRPALDLYYDYFGVMPLKASLGEYPLAIFPDGKDGPFHLRAVLDADQATGSLRVAGEVLEGACIRLTEVLSDGILAGSTQSAHNAITAYRGREPMVAFVFSCAARKWVLGTRAEQEIGLLIDTFHKAGVKPAIAGGYCFGEIGPATDGAPSEFHNETCVTVLLGK